MNTPQDQQSQAPPLTSAGQVSYRVFLSVLASLAVIALGYSVAPVVSPFLLLLSVFILLHPIRNDPFARQARWLSLFLFSIWFLYSLSSVLAPFILAFLAAYMLSPLADLLERKGVPRWTSSLFTVLFLIGIVAGGVLILFPLAIGDFQSLITAIGTMVAGLRSALESGVVYETLSRYGIAQDQFRSLVAEQFTPKLEGLFMTLFGSLLGLMTGASSLLLHLLNVVIIPFLVFYLLMDFRIIIDRFARFVPPSRRQTFSRLAGTVDGVLGQYFRGAVIVAIIQGIISGTVLWLIGVRYPLVLGIMTGLLNFIPYVGLVTSLVVSSVVAMLSGEPVTAKVVGVIVLYLSQKLLEATVLAPRIIGSRVGLHPVLLILCLLVFGHFLGFVGLLIAVPVTALIVTGIREWEESHKLPEGGV